MPITIKNMYFSFDALEQPLFEEVNLTIDTTWRLGLVGRNGRGKTTLLKLFMKQYPFRGEISSTEAFVYFPLTIKTKEQLAYYAIDEVMPIELWKMERECQLLGLDKMLLWQPFEQLSGGEQTKMLLAALFCDEAHFALLDEPTNHLDLATRTSVAKYLQQKQGYIVISHDQSFLDTVIDHVLVIEKSQLVLYKGDFSTYLEQKERQDQFEITQNKSLKSEIHRLQQTANEKSKWAAVREKPSGNDPFGNAVAKRMNKRAKAIEARVATKIEEKTKLLHNIESVRELTINTLASHRNPLLRLKDFTLVFDGKPVFQPISFEMYQGEQIAVVGVNGSGKTVLLNYLLTGNFAGEVRGEIQVPQCIKTSIIRQNHEDNQGSLKLFAEEQALDYTLFLNHLRILGMEREVFSLRIEQMSSGQKKKVEIAKSLGQLAELYIWDEPLNYLDLYNKKQIEAMIQRFQPTLLFVEHDQSFLSKIAIKTIPIIPY